MGSGETAMQHYLQQLVVTWFCYFTLHFEASNGGYPICYLKPLGTKKAQSNHKTRTPTQENKFNLLLKTIRNHRPSQVRKPQIRLQTLITMQTNYVQFEQ